LSFVLDNSVSMRWLFGDGKAQDIAHADSVLERLKQTGAIVPMTWGLEVAHVLARAEARAVVTEAQSGTFLKLLEGMDITADTATFQYALSDTLQLARRFRLSSYNASYLELALRLGLPLATLDETLLKAAEKAGVEKFV